MLFLQAEMEELKGFKEEKERFKEEERAGGLSRFSTSKLRSLNDCFWVDRNMQFSGGKNPRTDAQLAVQS